MFCCKIFILPLLIQKYYFPPATVEFNSKQISVETNLFRTDSHSKQLKVNRKEKSGSEKQSIHIYENNKTNTTEKKHHFDF